MKITLKLSEKDILEIKTCLQAAISEHFFDDWEFSTLIGAEKKDISKIIKNFNCHTIEDTELLGIIMNILTNLSGYPHNRDTILSDMTGLTKLEIDKLHNKIKSIS